MKTKFAFIIAAITGTLAMAVPAVAGETSDLLKSYESVSTALANDDLATAQTAATALADKARAEGKDDIASHANELAKSSSLEDAREHFKEINAEAEKLAEGHEGFHVMQCPMVDNAKWVQSGKKTMNPYMGKRMQQCGEMMEMRKDRKEM